MKSILSICFLLCFLSGTGYSAPLTAEKFIEHSAYSSELNRKCFGNLIMSFGVPLMATSVFIEDPDYKSLNLWIGGVYTGFGLLIKALPTGIEKREKELTVNSEKTAIDHIVEIKNNERNLRYIAAALYALPLFVDNSVDSTSLSSDDANLAQKTYFLSASLFFMFFKTPLEQYCESIISDESKRLDVSFKPGLTQTTLALNYQF